MTRKRNVKPRFWLLLMSIMVLVFAGVYLSQASFMHRQNDQIAQLELKKDEVFAQNAELERKIAFSKTDEYLERTARDRLGLLKPDEIRYVTSVTQAAPLDEE